MRHIEPTCFVRCDGNLQNFLWDGERICVVDFEDSGNGNWVCDLAEIVEHVRSRALSDDHWERFVARFDPPPALYRAARCMYAMFFLAAFRQRHDERAEEQSIRVRELLR